MPTVRCIIGRSRKEALQECFIESYLIRTKKGWPKVRLLFDGLNIYPGKVLAVVVDRALAAIGVSAAVGSAVFAGFMISQVQHPLKLEASVNPESFGQTAHNGPHPRAIASTGNCRLDECATGSIHRGGLGGAGAVPTVEDGRGKSRGAAGKYVIRFVHKGAALLQGTRGLYVVRRGSMLPDAVRILAIERHGDRWVVVTSKGLALPEITQTGF
jgi:hypothetical protein